MLNIALFGPPGAGKGTQSDWLVKKYNLTYISTGDILREEISSGTPLGIQAKNIIEKGGLVSDELVVQIIENRITKMIMAYHFDSKYQFYQGYNFLKIKELFSLQHMVQNLASSFSIFTKCLYEIQLFWTLLKIYTCLF